MPSIPIQRVPALSVVIPAHNEGGNIGGLLTEVRAALRGVCSFEIICVDDGSTDHTLAVLRQMQQGMSELRVLCHSRCSGQSAALRSGVHAARADWVATLDGDGQNDPADLPRLLLARIDAGPQVKLLAGWRTVRRDSWSKRMGSRIANAVRMRLLGDATPDTGCGIKLFERASFIELPAFSHMHRYLPALFQGFGHQTISVPVAHRPRHSGRSNYSNLGRLRVAFADLFGVAWLLRRRCVVASSELASLPQSASARDTSAPGAIPTSTPSQAAHA
jgi:dolichol-phosphate mannosyltransferase